MQVIGFFNGLFSVLGNVVGFITTPFGDLTGNFFIQNSPFGDMSILTMFGVGLFATLAVFLTIRLVQMVNPF